MWSWTRFTGKVLINLGVLALSVVAALSGGVP